ncbi:MAG: ECF transporter S component [Ruminococcaceae bacterium]|nr:ECF transporter S component [Oscillospiraceae bacterium]
MKSNAKILSNHVHRLVLDAMLAALFFALSMFSVDLGFIKFTVAPLAILIAGLLFGPVDGAVVGLIGAFLEQLIKYGFSVTMPLWILPAVVRGLLIGALALLMRRYFQKRTDGRFTPAKAGKNASLFVVFTVVCAILSAIVVTICNTLPLYVDFKVFGWSSENPLLWGALSARFVSGMLTSTILGLITPLVVIPASAAIERMKKPYLWK